MFLWLIMILFLVVGIWLIVAGKIPEGLFKALFGKGRYLTSPGRARLFGLLLISPFPVIVVVSFLIGMIFGAEAATYASYFTTAYIFAVAIAAIIVARRMKQPEAAV